MMGFLVSWFWLSIIFSARLRPIKGFPEGVGEGTGITDPRQICLSSLWLNGFRACFCRNWGGQSQQPILEFGLDFIWIDFLGEMNRAKHLPGFKLAMVDGAFLVSVPVLCFGRQNNV